MMRRILLFIICFLPVYACYSYADTVSSNDLIGKSKIFDNKKITYQGEAVTAILNRGEYSWVNVNDGYNALGIWAKAADLAKVTSLGSYKYKGDILEIEGVFHRACPLHGGEMDIHAEKITIVKKGFLVKKSPDFRKVYLAAVLFGFTLILVILFRKRI